MTNILIISPGENLTASLAIELATESNKVVLASREASKIDYKSNNIIKHTYDPSDPVFKETISNYKFDAVIFIGGREESALCEFSTRTPQTLDSLVNVLDLSVEENVQHFFYISSSEVFNQEQIPEEETKPIPSSKNGRLLVSSEEICYFYKEKFDLPISIVRVPFLYDSYENDCYLGSILTKLNNNQQVTLPSSQTSSIDFLHVKDLADFLLRAIDEGIPAEEPIFHLGSGKSQTMAEFAEGFEDYFSSPRFKFTSEDSIQTKPLLGTNARRFYGWAPLHHMVADLPLIHEVLVNGRPEEKPRALDEAREFYRTNWVIKWIELIGGAVLMQYLSVFTSTLIQFKFVDFRLLFVVLMGSVYGIRFGLLAALLAGLSIVYTWFQLNLDWTLLTYNIGNWFPFVVYFAAGAITGYVKDKKDAEIEYQQSQTKLIFEKYQFLYDVFNEISILKDEFREQIFRYRDSYGKMYRISQELDALNADEVFISALNVLEDVMSDDSIAIYSIDKSGNYLRLEANSPSLNGDILKSVKLSELPILEKNIQQGKIFQNNELLPDYPIFAAPIMNNNTPVAIVAIWKANFDQFSMYFFNLFQVITNLIQDALVRASLFREANIEKMYIPETNILTLDAFTKAFKIKTEMKKSKISDYQLLRIKKSHLSPIEIDSSLSKSLRSADIIGLWEDNNFYVLLNQADSTAVEAIIKRLAKSGIISDIVDSQEFYQLIV
jgi:UDP-glucose 4-epimerase